MARTTRSSIRSSIDTTKEVGPSNNEKLERKVESIGIELKARGSRWDEITRVLEMLCEINELAVDDAQWMEMLSLDDPARRKKLQADLNDCDRKIVRSQISINNVRLSAFYSASKTTYEDVRARHEKIVANNNGVLMASWTEGPAKAWLDAAKLVTIRGRCYPEESEKDNFKNAMDHMKRSVQKESDVKRLCDRYMEDTEKFMTWSALDKCVRPMQKIPHPAWPDDKDKKLDLLRFPTEKAEDEFLKQLLAFFELRITNLFVMEGYNWPTLAVGLPHGLVQVCQIRKFSRTLLKRNDEAVWLKEWASYEHITAGNKQEMIKVLLVYFSKLLTIDEASNNLDEFRTMASKDEAVTLSRIPLNKKQMLKMEQFEMKHIQEIKRHIFFWRLRKGLGPWKKNETKARVSAEKLAARSGTELCLDRVGVTFINDRQYCYYLPVPFAEEDERRGCKDSGFLALLPDNYNGQDLLEALLDRTGNLAFDDIVQVLCDNPGFSDHKEDAECAPFFKVIKELEDFRKDYKRGGVVTNDRFQSLQRVCKDLVELLEHAMDEPLKKLKKLAGQEDLKWPKIVHSCAYLRYEPPGAVWITKRLEKLQEFHSFCFKLMLNSGILRDDSWAPDEGDRGLSDDTTLMVAAKVLGLHRPSMGKTKAHYTASLHTWMSPMCGSGAVREVGKMLFKIIRAHTEENFEPKDPSPVTETFKKCFKSSTKATNTCWTLVDAATAEYIKLTAKSTTKKKGAKRTSSSTKEDRAAKKTKTAEPQTPAKKSSKTAVVSPLEQGLPNEVAKSTQNEGGTKKRGPKNGAAKKTTTDEPQTPAKESLETIVVSPPEQGNNEVAGQAHQDQAAVEAAAELYHVSI